MYQCCVCRGSLTLMLDLGLQPVTNRFLESPDAEESRFPIKLACCDECGMVQLVESAPADELMPRLDWIAYNEPEAHLDALTAVIADLPMPPQASGLVAGLTYKDDSTLERLRRHGFTHYCRYDPAQDMGILEQRAGIETIQQKLVPNITKNIADRYGLADVLIVRHILEHCQEPTIFLNALKTLLTPAGYIVFEVPDCEKAFKARDYTTVWEEHRLYFTQETFLGLLRRSGYEVVYFESYPYPFENSLVAIARLSSNKPELTVADTATPAAFSQRFSSHKKLIASFLSHYRQHTGKIAMYGAGHIACAYLNYYGVADQIEFVVDDNVNKQHKYMPGSKLPIMPSTALVEQGIKLCLLCLIPEVEARVVAKNEVFLAAGGKFASIYPGSQTALQYENNL